MTCIVGIVDRETGDVHMGADSVASSGMTVMNITTPGKLFKAHGLLFGMAGHVRFGQIVKHMLDVRPYDADGDLEAYLCGPLVCAMVAAKETTGYVCEDGQTGTGFLIGGGGRLFEMSDSFDVVEMSENYASIGCGYPFALGALRTSAALPVAERLTQALEAAAFFSPDVRAPFFYETI